MIFFVLSGNGEECVSCKTAEGEEAIAVFDTQELADEFARSRPNAGWRSESRHKGGEAMFYKRLRDKGIVHLARNPKPGEIPTDLQLVTEVLARLLYSP